MFASHGGDRRSSIGRTHCFGAALRRINWDASFSVGVYELDSQHERIVRLINALVDGSDTTVRSESVSDALDRLTKYAAEHFRCEERMLEECGYPALEQQRAEHRRFRREITTLCLRVTAHDDAAPYELLAFLVHWWERHILVDDMAYKQFLADHGRS